MPLHCLVRDKDKAGIDAYIKSGRDLELKDNWGRSALFWALWHQQYDMFYDLLDAKSDPDTVDENGISLFYQAVVLGKYAVAKRILESGADIDALNGKSYPQTALHYCVLQNNSECVRFLLEQGANPYLEDSFGYNVFERVRLHDHIDKAIGKLLKKNTVD
ncbi:MAG: ankyrin repeat domain-containing protein [gamma proteobacterium symbiont of Bathyaustriella thionipta]|nr:ankyrin repeat domain-containing protein [gamma proteobacterium symbiont of Bathyaustriella thionipta]